MHARLLFCLEQQQHEARRNCGTDHTRHIRAHCVHEQEGGGVGLAAFLLGDTRRHWNSGNTSRADQGVYLAFCNEEHQLAQKHAACCRERKGDKAEAYNGKRLHL